MKPTYLWSANFTLQIKNLLIDKGVIFLKNTLLNIRTGNYHQIPDNKFETIPSLLEINIRLLKIMNCIFIFIVYSCRYSIFDLKKYNAESCSQDDEDATNDVMKKPLIFGRWIRWKENTSGFTHPQHDMNHLFVWGNHRKILWQITAYVVYI